MSPTQKQTYFVYNEGYDKKMLRIGSLALDYANPRLRRPHIFAKEVEPGWVNADQRNQCYIACQNQGSWGFGVGLLEILSLNYSRFNDNVRIVAGPEGSVTELIDPHKFFQEVVLGSDEARLWLEIRLSIANKMQLLWKKFQHSPKIWLLTGIYEIKDATTSVISRNGTERGVEVTVPIPEPTGLTTLLLKPGGSVNLGSGTTLSSRSQILGLKVWAAQWQQVEARFLLAEEWKNTDVVANKLRLLDVMSLQVERGADHTQFVEVGLKQEDAEDLEEEKESLDEEYWEIFDREVQRLEEDFEE